VAQKARTLHPSSEVANLAIPVSKSMLRRGCRSCRAVVFLPWMSHAIAPPMVIAGSRAAPDHSPTQCRFHQLVEVDAASRTPACVGADRVDGVERFMSYQPRRLRVVAVGAPSPRAITPAR